MFLVGKNIFAKKKITFRFLRKSHFCDFRKIFDFAILKENFDLADFFFEEKSFGLAGNLILRFWGKIVLRF